VLWSSISEILVTQSEQQLDVVAGLRDSARDLVALRRTEQADPALTQMSRQAASNTAQSTRITQQ
jgi:hypothetical protein